MATGSERFGQRERGKPRQQPGHQNQPVTQQAQQPKGPRNRDDCPRGWDATLWSLTLQFEQYAWADKIQLVAGRPVIYSELADLVERHDMQAKARDKRYRQAVRGCTRRDLPASLAEKCWLHHPPTGQWHPRDEYLTWEQMVQVIMAEFWSRIQDQYALDMFRRCFREYGQLAMGHWVNLRVAQRCDEIRASQRNDDRGTMAADSEEG